MDKNRRRCYWINPRGQGAYVFRILLLELAVAVVSVILTVFVMKFFIDSPGEGGAVLSAGAYWTKIFWFIIGLCVFAAAILGFAGIRLSHRFFGAAYHLQRVFREANENNSFPGRFICVKKMK